MLKNALKVSKIILRAHRRLLRTTTKTTLFLIECVRLCERVCVCVWCKNGDSLLKAKKKHISLKLFYKFKPKIKSLK